MIALLVGAGLLGALAAWAVHRHTEGRAAPVAPRPGTLAIVDATFAHHCAEDDASPGCYSVDEQMRDALRTILLLGGGL